MRYQNVSIAAVSHVDAPHIVTSAQIMERLAPQFAALGLRENLLEDVAGITSRRVYDPETPPSDAAVDAAEVALAECGIDRNKIGLLVNTSVCRDFLEPSTASIVHGKLGLGEHCQNFDVGNACLGFMNGMDIASRMIELGEIEYAIIVNGENSGLIAERTVERMLRPGITIAEFRAEFASLTLGSGGAAMVMGHRDLLPDGPRYLGSVTRAATQWRHLCVGNIDRMITDTRGLLIQGVKLAAKTVEIARAMYGWVMHEIDEFVIHQVSKAHTDEFVRILGIDPRKVFTIFPELGNIGPASIPFAISKMKAAGRLQKGKRLALVGVGSGLNCTVGEVVW